MTASGENSARPPRVFVQILLLLALKGRCSSRPSPVRHWPRRRRRPSNARKCSINAIICTLVISSRLTLFRCLPFRVLLLLAWPVPAMCDDARHRFVPMAAGRPSIAEIAYSIGYSNVSYFNKWFKEGYGCPQGPSEPSANRRKCPSLATICTLLAVSENSLPTTAPSSLC
jgi:AraC-like DNA-binding protein